MKEAPKGNIFFFLIYESVVEFFVTINHNINIYRRLNPKLMTH